MGRRAGGRVSRGLMLAMSIVVVANSGCAGGDDLSGPGSGNARISTEEEAEAAFTALKSAAEAVDLEVATDFSAPLTVSGAAGAASVTGDKTSSSTSSFSSSTTTRQTDLTVDFADFKSSADGMTVSGSVRWFDYYYSRTACSDSGCASASDHSEALEGTSLEVTFEYDGKTYSDEIDVDASSGSDSSSWDVEVTNGAGESFTFSY